MIPSIEIWHTKSGQASTQIDSSMINWDLKRGIEAKQTRVDINLKCNPHLAGGKFATNFIDNFGNITIDEGDTIQVYADWAPMAEGFDGKPSSDENLLITAEIQEIGIEEGEKRTIKLKCVDKTWLLLSKSWSYAYTINEGKYSPDIVKEIIQHVTKDLGGEYQITTNNVATVKSDGSAFDKIIAPALIWKTAYEWIETVSTPEMTLEDRNYIFYVDEDNDLHWYYPYQKGTTHLDGAIDDDDTTIPVDLTSGYPTAGVIQIEDEQITYTGKTSTTFTGCTRGAYGTIAASHSDSTAVTAQILKEGQNNITSIKLNKSVFDVLNFIIYNAGKVPWADFEYHWYSYDVESEYKDFRMAVMDWKFITNDLMTQVGNDDADQDGYPDSYPYTCPWTDRKGNPVIVNNNGEYEDAFFDAIKMKGDEEAQKLFQKVGSARWKGDIEMKGTKYYFPGDMIYITFPSFGINNLKIRITDVHHIINQQGWFTSLEVTEDEEARQ